MKKSGFVTRAEIANELNISTKTLSRKLKKLKIDIPPRQLISPITYERIRSAFYAQTDV